MKDHSKQFLIDNIYILVDRNYHSYNENILNQYVVIDYDEHNIYLLSKHGLINKYENYKFIEWIPNNLEIGDQFQKIEMTFYNEDYTQVMYAYEMINLPIFTYLKPMRKYHTSIQSKRIIDICSILISNDDLSHLSDIKDLTNDANKLESFLTEH